MPRKHGMTKSPEFFCWHNMRMRCSTPTSSSYHLYGARGIKVCPRWSDSFENFLADMGPRPSPKHSLDRIDSNGNYEPANCRWATAAEQAANRRSVRNITHGGVTASIAEWARRTGLKEATIAYRLNRGLPPAAVLRPVAGMSATCRRGHLLAGENLRLRQRGARVERVCKACRRERDSTEAA